MIILTAPEVRFSKKLDLGGHLGATDDEDEVYLDRSRRTSREFIEIFPLVSFLSVVHY